VGREGDITEVKERGMAGGREGGKCVREEGVGRGWRGGGRGGGGGVRGSKLKGGEVGLGEGQIRGGGR